MYRKTYVEVDVDALKSNVKNIIEKYSEYEYYIGVVKGNAYGHGMEIVKYIVEAGINYLAVSSLEEALEVRKYDSSTPILCLEPIDFCDLSVAQANNVSVTLHSYEYIQKLLEMDLDKKLKVHIKLDTGMNRLGLKEEAHVTQAYNFLLAKENIELEGIYSHFGTLGVYDKEWDTQLKRFRELTKNIDLSKIKMVHFARGQNVINHKKIPETNGIRLGISMYGYVNNFSAKASSLKGKIRQYLLARERKKLGLSYCIFDDVPKVTPAFSLKSEVLQIKEVKKGEIVGYGDGYRAPSDILVATIPVGYADGVSVKNTGRCVDINGKLYKIVGTVNMCMLSVAVDNTVKVGDTVTIIGGMADAKYVADYLGVNRYIVVTTVASNIPRVYIKKSEDE